MPDITHALTARELHVLHALARGLNSFEVGEALGISPSTVKTHSDRARRKLHARNTTHAVALCYEMNVWAPNERIELPSFGWVFERLDNVKYTCEEVMENSGDFWVKRLADAITDLRTAVEDVVIITRDHLSCHDCPEEVTHGEADV